MLVQYIHRHPVSVRMCANLFQIYSRVRMVHEKTAWTQYGTQFYVHNFGQARTLSDLPRHSCGHLQTSLRSQFLPREAMLSAVFAVVVCLCVSVCLSVTLRYCIKTAKLRITQTTPHDSPMILVF